MTDIEISRLLSELAESAKALNNQSDSINHVISDFEGALSKLNIGLEVWLVDQPLSSKPWHTEADDDENVLSGLEATQLGFCRLYESWQLAVRTARYQHDGEDTTLIVERIQGRLLDASRRVRIEALKVFPALLRALKQETDAAVTAIADAKKFVK